MASESLESERRRVRCLQEKDVEILNPESVTVGTDVDLDNIEPGVRIGPGTVISGNETMIGATLSRSAGSALAG